MSSQVLSSGTNDYSNQVLLSFTQGIEWDKKLYKQELKVQTAWLNVLLESGVISQSEKSDLSQSLKEIGLAIANEEFDWDEKDEDIHMNIERVLIEKHGLLGKKVHTGRSRNDLIATTLKLHVSDFVDEVNGQLVDLATVLLEQAKQFRDVIVPGSTHLQHAQPTTFGHILMSHAWPILRVKESFLLAKKFAMKSLPLGAAAFNGSTLAADYFKLAQSLGFESSCDNSYEAVGGRDDILQVFSAMQLHAVHLAKLAQDIIYWSSTPVGILQLPHKWSTGSSIMPNKRNPDIAELIRAKSVKIMAKPAHQLMATFGSSYFSDLHELKKSYLETGEEVMSIHKVLTPFLNELSVDQPSAHSLLHRGHILATDLANQLTAEGKSFREAYKMTAEHVAKAEEMGVQVHELENVDISFEAVLANRSFSGGSGTDAFEEQCVKFASSLDGGEGCRVS
ncbi:argininosuccinate lyase [Oligoflexaceae bacterium]|nr:argininosuccinate lyase [Oligoflexaceae bacterium]